MSVQVGTLDRGVRIGQAEAAIVTVSEPNLLQAGSLSQRLARGARWLLSLPPDLVAVATGLAACQLALAKGN